MDSKKTKVETLKPAKKFWKNSYFKHFGRLDNQKKDPPC